MLYRYFAFKCPYDSQIPDIRLFFKLYPFIFLICNFVHNRSFLNILPNFNLLRTLEFAFSGNFRQPILGWEFAKMSHFLKNATFGKVHLTPKTMPGQSTPPTRYNSNSLPVFILAFFPYPNRTKISNLYPQGRRIPGFRVTSPLGNCRSPSPPGNWHV